MNKRNKIILIGFFSFCMVALALGIYLLPDEEPMVVDRSDVPPQKTIPQQSSKNSADAFLKNESTTVSPATNAPASKSDTGTSKTNPYVSYPDKTLLELAGIDMGQLLEERDASKNTVIHVEWMDRVNEILKDLDPEKKAAIIKNHTSLLYIKDKLNEAYLTGKIDHATFIKAVSDLMKWHQRTYDPMLTGDEYEALFDITPEQASDTVDALFASAPEYGFIFNKETSVDTVKGKVQGDKLEAVDTHFKKMIFDRDNIGKQIGSGEMTLEQAREALKKTEQAFFSKCKEILTEDEINTIFGSVEALEASGTITERPKVLDDEDEIKLGFKIENPKTSVDDVTKTIDKNKIEDIKFFWQQRKQEREELIKKLDAKKISEEELENISTEMDAAFEENCRNTLTDAEFKLIFDMPQPQSSNDEK